MMTHALSFPLTRASTTRTFTTEGHGQQQARAPGRAENKNSNSGTRLHFPGSDFSGLASAHFSRDSEEAVSVFTLVSFSFAFIYIFIFV